MKILPFPNKRNDADDALNITIFGDVVMFGILKFHISEIMERKLPEECKDSTARYYISEQTIEDILNAYHQNNIDHPNEQLSDWEDLRKTHPPQYIAGLATKNRNVIETILEKNLFSGKLGLVENPVVTESDLIRILKSENIDTGIRINVAKHPNLTKEVIKLFANENSDCVIWTLKSRTDIKDLVDADVKSHFKKCGSEIIKSAFVYNKLMRFIYSFFKF